jgi:hypothetical protein
MTDTAITTSRALGDSDPIDLDRLTASLDHLNTHFCNGGNENDAAASSPDVCEPIVLTGNDNDLYIDGLNRSAVLFDSAQLSVVAKEAA